MKLLSTLLISSFFIVQASWLTNMEQAKKESYQKHRLILLNFSGSDWCSPCIQLKKKIFESEAFNQYADTSLILVNADFPRKKKNKPSAEQIALNDALAEKYNPDGKFPFTLLLNDGGKVLKAWDGNPDVSPEEFVHQLQEVPKSLY